MLNGILNFMKKILNIKNKEEKEKMESSGPKSNFVRSLFKKKVGK